ncbi:unnamed protein product [Malus baccata var. baccata]
MALDCFRTAQLDPQANGSSVDLDGYLQKSKKLELMSRTGAFDLSEWVVNGFRGKPLEPAEYIGAVQIKKSEIRGRGLFATKNIDVGTLMLVTKAVAIERGILPGQELDENAQLLMWKNITEKVMDSMAKDELEVPEINRFKPEAEHNGGCHNENELDASRILSILDVNSLVEGGISSKILGKNSDYYGVGLWVLASFINHSCAPNARRMHIGDYVMVHASRDVKAGEEITFAYFDVLSPLEKRNESCKTWGFRYNCKRCKFEKKLYSREDVREIEMGLERRMEAGAAVYKLEEGLRRWMVKEREKGYLRASFWDACSQVYGTGESARGWGRRIPPMETAVDSVVEAVGSHERVLRMVAEKLKRWWRNVGDGESFEVGKRGVQESSEKARNGIHYAGFFFFRHVDILNYSKQRRGNLNSDAKTSENARETNLIVTLKAPSLSSFPPILVRIVKGKYTKKIRNPNGLKPQMSVI